MGGNKWRMGRRRRKGGCHNLHTAQTPTTAFARPSANPPLAMTCTSIGRNPASGNLQIVSILALLRGQMHFRMPQKSGLCSQGKPNQCWVSEISCVRVAWPCLFNPRSDLAQTCFCSFLANPGFVVFKSMVRYVTGLVSWLVNADRFDADPAAVVLVGVLA